MRNPVQLVDLPATRAIAIHRQVPMADLAVFFGDAFGRLAAFAQAHGVVCSDMPFARYFKVSPEEVEVEALMPVNRPVSGEGDVIEVNLPPGRAASVRHVGPYWTLTETYADLERWMTEHHHTSSDVAREVYLSGPAGLEPEEWVTMVIQPIEPPAPRA
jgi:effector-binding domain-containing protein